MVILSSFGSFRVSGTFSVDHFVFWFPYCGSGFFVGPLLFILSGRLSLFRSQSLLNQIPRSPRHATAMLIGIFDQPLEFLGCQFEAELFV
jgi:hypothetical protein